MRRGGSSYTKPGPLPLAKVKVSVCASVGRHRKANTPRTITSSNSVSGPAKMVPVIRLMSRSHTNESDVEGHSYASSRCIYAAIVLDNAEANRRCGDGGSIITTLDGPAIFSDQNC